MHNEKVKKKKGNLNHDKDLAHVIHPANNMNEDLLEFDGESLYRR